MRLTLLVLFLSACAMPCGGPHLVPAPTAEVAVFFEGGSDRAIALYDRAGSSISSRWIDSSARWARESSPFASGAHLWWVMPLDRVGIVQPTSLAMFDWIAEDDAIDVTLSAAPRDVIEGQTGIVVATSHAIVIVDPIARTEVRSFDVTSLPPLGRLAIVGDRLVIGTDSNGIVVASMDGASAALSPLAATVNGCDDVVALAPNVAFAAPRAAVLCHGTGSNPASRRPSAGLFLIEVPASGMPHLLSSMRAFDRDVPSDALVALSDSWVAMHAQGSADLGLPDAVLAVDLTAQSILVLVEERYNFTWGRPLGSGALVPASGEIWWPSVTAGLLRWHFDGAGVTPLDAITHPSCVSVPPRDARALR